jgi:hypothetical protein
MWPREVFYRSGSVNPRKRLSKELEFLERPGVYVLYRDDVPYYIGKARNFAGVCIDTQMCRRVGITTSGTSFLHLLSKIQNSGMKLKEF